MSSKLKAFKERAKQMLGSEFRSHLADDTGNYWLGEITDGHEDEREAATEYVAGLREHRAKQPLPAPNDPAAG